MDITATVSLLFAMIVLALIPGPGTMIVTSRSISHGLKAGLITAFGIVGGDYVFILLAVSGLSVLADVMGEYFLIIKYIGAAYLIILGLMLMFTKSKPSEVKVVGSSSLNFIAGLVTTLSNPKAILFYVSFFPAFIDLASVTLVDIIVILVVATFSVGGVMAAYALMASKAGQYVNKKLIKYGAGSILIGSGLTIATKSP